MRREVSVVTHHSRYQVARAGSAGRLAARLGLTGAGAAGLVVGGVLPWTGDLAGTDLTVRALYQTGFTRSDSFVSSVGFVSVVLGLVALLGLVNPTGWLTRLAGVLGVAAFVLFAVQAYRATGRPFGPDFGEGAWLALAGAVAALLGGHFGRYFPVITRVVVRPPAARDQGSTTRARK